MDCVDALLVLLVVIILWKSMNVKRCGCGKDDGFLSKQTISVLHRPPSGPVHELPYHGPHHHAPGIHRGMQPVTQQGPAAPGMAAPPRMVMLPPHAPPARGSMYPVTPRNGPQVPVPVGEGNPLPFYPKKG